MDIFDCKGAFCVFVTVMCDEDPLGLGMPVILGEGDREGDDGAHASLAPIIGIVYLYLLFHSI